MSSHYLSIDIGGTSIKYGLVDASGVLYKSTKVPLPTTIDDLKKWLAQVIDKNRDIQGIGICCPGKINSVTTLISNAGAVPYLDHTIFKAVLPDNLNIPVAIENDAKAATLAEMWLGNLKDITNGAALILGTSIGGGIVINGDLVPGDHLQAGEVGYMITDPTAKISKKKLAGFNASAVGMIRQINEEVSNPNLLDGYAAFDAIRISERARQIFEAYCRRIGQIIITLNSVIDVSKIVIGGGISAQDELIVEINRQYDYFSDDISVIKRRLTKPTIIAAKFLNDANLYGAVYKLLLQIDRDRVMQ